jgi:hypothetical protein
MLYREIIAVCSGIHTKHIKTLCGQNVEFVNVKPGGTYSNRWASNTRLLPKRAPSVSGPEGLRTAATCSSQQAKVGAFLKKPAVGQLEKTPRILRSPEVPGCVHKSTQPVAVLTCEHSPPHRTLHLKIHFCIILPSMSRSSEWDLPSKLSRGFPHSAHENSTRVGTAAFSRPRPLPYSCQLIVQY